MNAYPNDNNFPVVSFDQPVQSPDVDPDAGDLIYAGFNEAWVQVLCASIDQLRLPSTWEGTDDEKRLATMRANTLKMLLANATVPSVPAPFWDNDEDVDDQAPGDDQEWYGREEDLTWQEDVSIWLITGFIAYSGQIGAAIAFRTFAKKFVLAFKKDGLGGAVRVFINGVDSGLLDTHDDAGGILEAAFVGDPDEEEQDIMIVLESVPT